MAPQKPAPSTRRGGLHGISNDCKTRTGERIAASLGCSAALSQEERNQLPNNPAGMIELSGTALDAVAGASGAVGSGSNASGSSGHSSKSSKSSGSSKSGKSGKSSKSC